MSLYLLEIGCEEIPARFFGEPSFLTQLKDKLTLQLDKHHVAYKEIALLGTLRRLTLSITLEAQTKTVEQTLKGPLQHIAMTQTGELTPAGLGFLKRYSLEKEAVFTQEEQGKVSIYAKKTTPCQPVEAVLPLCVQDAIASLTLPVAMKWGNGQGPFIRPVHWIVSLLDDRVVPLSLFGIEAGRVTYGHRMLTKNSEPGFLISGIPLSLSHSKEYENTLKVYGSVQVDPDKRRNFIETELKNQEIALRQDFPNLLFNLLDEVTWLTEYPVVLQGSFDPQFLQIPKQVLIETMTKNQKYFPILKNGTLTSNFLVAAENVTPRSSAQIIAGNQQVLRARLEDAKFFWEEDIKTPLESKREALKNITFQKGLGSVYDKSERIKALSTYLCDVLHITKEDRAQILRTAYLCKADLTTHMVYEFGSLQGIMGGLYAQRDGEPDAVCKGIEEHYSHATTLCGLIVGIADRLDTIVACFANNLIPTGSQDPLGVRRALYGILELLIESRAEILPRTQQISLYQWVKKAYEILGSDLPNQDACLHYVQERSVSYLSERGIAASFIAAMDHYLMSDFFQAIFNSNQLMVPNEGTRLFIETGIRIKRMVKNHLLFDNVDQNLFQLDIEKTVFDMFQTHERTENFFDLYAFDRYMPDYFEQVLVMDKDPKIQKNRLAFLSHLNALYMRFADFEKLN